MRRVVLLALKNLLFTLIVPGTVAVYVPLRLVRGSRVHASAWSAAGVIVLALGAVVYLACVWEFGRTGRGTPAPIDAPTLLVARGLYRFTRNPMYVGVLLVIAGWALLFESRALGLYGLVVASAFHLFVVLYEEPHLRRVFGQSYTDYCARVGRWLPRRSKSTGTSARPPRRTL